MTTEVLSWTRWQEPEPLRVSQTVAAAGDALKQSVAQALEGFIIADVQAAAVKLVNCVAAPADVSRYLVPHSRNWGRDSFSRPDIVSGAGWLHRRSDLRQLSLVFEFGRATAVVLRNNEEQNDAAEKTSDQVLRRLETQVSAVWAPWLTRKHQDCLLEAIRWHMSHYETEDGIEPDWRSLSGLLHFLSEAPEADDPAITLGDDGSFTATWQRERSRRLSLRFRNEKDAMLAAVEIGPDGQLKTGEVENYRVADLRSKLTQHGILEWLRVAD